MLIYLLGLANLICYIIVLVKLFNDKGVLHGVLGLLCGVYAFIWGWMNVSRQNLMFVMIAWTLLILVTGFFNFVVLSTR
jgi:hypothetical protein